MSLFLQELFFGTFQIPENFTTRKHSISGKSISSKPVARNAKGLVLIALGSAVWKTNKQIAKETELPIARVQYHTANFFVAGKIERSVRGDPGDVKPVYLYRISNANVD